ncbi:MAG: S41 family peptidase [Lachnospiraceae bacterium]|nr:S41 family peptidase [Lachnospiraceae bacterium]
MELKEATQSGFVKGILTGLFFACIACICIFFATSKKENTDDSLITKEIESKVSLIKSSIDRYFLNEYDEKTMEEGIYKGIVQSLDDPYSTYYSSEELKELREKTEGIYYGIGAYVSIDKETEGGMITKVMPGSPAEEAGVKDNDIIVKVDDESVLGLSITDIVTKIKGPNNTQVTLTLFREGVPEYVEIPVTRKKIETPTVISEMMEDDIAYIQITEFDSVTTQQFAEALTNAKEAGMKGLILDLRDNPGGNLTDVINISRMLLPRGLIVYTEDKNGSRQEYRCDGANEIQQPMVVLVNGNSASASEILSGAIKDYKKGTILGTTTYGKGIVQKIFGVTDGSALKLTVSHYYTPNGNDIHGVGIEPNETLEFDVDAYLEDGTDNQLERALEILKGKQ